MFVKKLHKSISAEDTVLFTLSFLWICVIIHVVILRPAESFPVHSEDGTPASVLILDPGHGGADGGAVAPDGTHESALNLSVSLRIRDLCTFLGIHTVMTRDLEDLSYPLEAKTIASMKKWDTRRRVEIGESVDSPVFLSIHQNIYPSATPRGAQVLYASGGQSRAFAELLQSALTDNLLPENRRVPMPAGEDIYIMSHLSCTAVLVECGFLSHPQELLLLQSAKYQKKIASVLTACYLQFTEKGVL